MTRYYSTDHEWVEVEGDTATIGITTYAQSQLGDIVFVELPEEGRILAKGKEAAVVESVKAASDVYAAVSGTVIVSNTELEATPSLANEDPEGKAWFFKVTLTDKGELDDLMDKEAYDKFLETL